MIAPGAPARRAVLAFAVLLPLVEVGRVALGSPTSHAVVTAVGTAVVLPLHLRHVLAGLRGQPPAHAGWTLAAMAAVLAAVTAVVGLPSALLLACLGASFLLTVPAPGSLVALAAVAAWAGLLVDLGDPVEVARIPYRALAVVYRSLALFLLVWLVAAASRLAADREAPAAGAVAAERARVATDVLWSARAATSTFPAAAARTAARLDAGDADGAATTARGLVDAARTTLGDVRRALREQPGDDLRAAGALLDGGPDPAPAASDPVPASMRASLGGVAFERFLGRVHHRRWLVVVSQAPLGVFAMLEATTGLGFQMPPERPVLAGLLMAVLLAVVLRLGLATAAGRRLPERHLLVAVAVAVAAGPLPWFGYAWTYGPPLLVAATLLAYGPRIGVPVAVAVLLWMPTGQEVLAAGELPPLPLLLWAFPYYVAALGVGVASVYAGAVLVRTASELVEARRRLALRARDEERARLARDLHDVLGHRLSALSLTGELVLRLLPRDPAAARERTTELTGIAEALDREVDAVLSGAEAPTLSGESTAAGALLRTAGVATHVEVAAPDLPAAQDELLGWAVREGVTNVLRHSDARRCSITAHERSGRVRLQLANDGVRPSGGDPGAGLRGLEQRARALGGEVEAGVDPVREERFVLTVSVPLR